MRATPQALLTLRIALIGTSMEAAEDRPRNYPRNWWPEMLARLDDWYASDEGKRIATNILSRQDESGG
jgi:hypothetical protein